MDRQAAATVFGRQDEGGAVHGLRIGSDPRHQSPDEAGLSRSQLADQPEERPGMCGDAQAAAEGLGLGGAPPGGLPPGGAPYPPPPPPPGPARARGRPPPTPPPR